MNAPVIPESKIVEIINSFPRIESKRYLELGVRRGCTFNFIWANQKCGVDTDDQCPLLTHHMTTDEFFVKHGKMLFDIIFIDADHTVKGVLQDFNNSINVLAEGGIILVHDMCPKSVGHTKPEKSGDGFKLLCHKLMCRYEGESIYVSRDNDGLTMFIDPVAVDVSKTSLDKLALQDLYVILRSYKTYSHDEMCLIAKNICDIIPTW